MVLAGLASVVMLSLVSCSVPGRSNPGRPAIEKTECRLAEITEAPAAQGHAGFPAVWSPVINAADTMQTLGWRHHKLPGKQATVYAFSPVDQRMALSATAVSSASMLRQSLRVEPGALRHAKVLMEGAGVDSRCGFDTA